MNEQVRTQLRAYRDRSIERRSMCRQELSINSRVVMDLNRMIAETEAEADNLRDLIAYLDGLLGDSHE